MAIADIAQRPSLTVDTAANPIQRGTAIAENLPLNGESIPGVLKDGDIAGSGTGTLERRDLSATDGGRAPVLELPLSAPPPWPLLDRFDRLVLWKGRVLAVKKDSFIAELFDQAQRDAREQAEIAMQEISDDDLGLIAPGSTFYWAIGYNVNSARRRDRRSVIRFQRLPTWSREEVERALKAADELNLEIDLG